MESQPKHLKAAPLPKEDIDEDDMQEEPEDEEDEDGEHGDTLSGSSILRFIYFIFIISNNCLRRGEREREREREGEREDKMPVERH